MVAWDLSGEINRLLQADGDCFIISADCCDSSVVIVGSVVLCSFRQVVFGSGYGEL